MSSGFFSCQKENTLLKSDETISIELAQDQDFKDYFKGFEAMVLKIKNVDPGMLEKLKNSTSEAEVKAILKGMDIEGNMNYLVTKAISLKKRYGDGINENVLKMTINSLEGKLLNINEHSNIENSLIRLRSESLPCSDQLDLQIAAIGAGYLTALYGCAGTTGLFLGCAGLATAGAIIAVELALSQWDACMADLYNHH